MNIVTRVALTYEEDLLLEVCDNYQKYWISYEQYESNSDLYKVDYKVAQQIKHMRLAKKCKYISSPTKCQSKNIWDCGLFFS